MLDVMPSRKWWKNSLAVQAAGAFLATYTFWRVWSKWTAEKMYKGNSRGGYEWLCCI